MREKTAKTEYCSTGLNPTGVDYPYLIPSVRTCVVLSLVIAVSSAPQASDAQDSQPQPEASALVEGQVFDSLGGGVEGVEVSLWPKDEDDVGSTPIATAKTDEYGDFQIVHDTPLSGEHVVLFKKDGYAHVRRTVELGSGDWPPFIDLSLPGAITISGSVTDKLKKAPAPGVQVRLNVLGRNWKVLTKADGSFQIEEVVPGSGVLIVDAEGYARAEVEIPDTRQTGPIRIELSPERIVELQIIDASGRPVSAATVECLDEESGDYRSLVSDEHGRAVLRGARLDATEIIVRVTHARFVSDAGFDRLLDLPPDKERSHHQLVLKSAGRIVGLVVDAESGRPLHGVRVSVGGDLSGSVRQWTGFDGRYAIAGAPPGETVATTYLNGYAPQLRNLTVTADQETTLDFALGPPRQAGGVVVNEQDQPIENAYIFAILWRGHATLGAEALTGANGRFVLHNLPDDEFKVTVQAAGYRSLTAVPVSPSSPEAVHVN